MALAQQSRWRWGGPRNVVFCSPGTQRMHATDAAESLCPLALAGSFGSMMLGVGI
jgi:hypothetical protein